MAAKKPFPTWKERGAAQELAARLATQRRQQLGRYGITEEIFAKAFIDQEGRCAGCTRLLDCPHIDHNHKSGCFRGLLCRQCNFAIGMVGDSPRTLRALADYLEQPPRTRRKAKGK